MIHFLTEAGYLLYYTYLIVFGTALVACLVGFPLLFIILIESIIANGG